MIQRTASKNFFSFSNQPKYLLRCFPPHLTQLQIPKLEFVYKESDRSIPRRGGDREKDTAEQQVKSSGTTAKWKIPSNKRAALRWP
ncbi:hypothetical protein AVEN_237980-1 [Araneus ventricosus]|uniref:Uncharacterized protein n=1 Tax=Araneus ventricosus TaxID=182803 RepID=A0A4Y2G548_ARAVE|nr:hypothetical protein AVEN_237980-1 [Araneus ventricosus]